MRRRISEHLPVHRPAEIVELVFDVAPLLFGAPSSRWAAGPAPRCVRHERRPAARKTPCTGKRIGHCLGGILEGRKGPPRTARRKRRARRNGAWVGMFDWACPLGKPPIMPPRKPCHGSLSRQGDCCSLGGMPDLRGERVLLRAWCPTDLPAFAALNADPRVMEYLPKELSREESDALARRCQEGLDARGYGLWAVEVPGMADFIGYVGLSVPRFAAAFTPCVEVGWRIAHEHWGRGYATEAARLALAFGFGQAALEEIVSFTVPANRRSRAVMERLGMTHDPKEDFDPPTAAGRGPAAASRPVPAAAAHASLTVSCLRATPPTNACPPCRARASWRAMDHRCPRASTSGPPWNRGRVASPVHRRARPPLPAPGKFPPAPDR